MLIEALTEYFESFFDRAKHHDTVLWFDPDQEYAALLDQLTELSLWRYEGSLLQVRYRLIHRAPDERTVVYLPLPQKEAEVLRPFFATSLVFRERLYRHVQSVNLMGAREGSETGVAFFVAMVSAFLGKPMVESLVVLGEMSLRGGLLKVGSLTERLQLAIDNGAKRVLLPSENKRDFADIPSDVLDKLQIIFYSDPVNAAFRAMGLE